MYRELYYALFGSIADAIELLEANRPERAKEILIAAQQKAEEKFLNEDAEIPPAVPSAP